jgi:serine/threonine-protein kinase
MLAGAPPFTGPTARSVLARHAVDRVPPLHTVRETVPPAVEAAIERALAKVPADRFATAGEFSAALERYSGAPAIAATAGVRWHSVLPSRRVVGVLSGLAVLGVMAVLAYQSRQPLALAPAVQRQITFTGRTGAPAISPDGKWLAYVTSNQAGTRDPAPRFSLKVQPLPSGDPVTLADSVFGQPPVWSPDGNNLMFVGRTRSTWFVGIQTVARVGGRVTQVAPLSWVYGYRPDGKALIRASFDTLVIQDILSGAEVQRISLDGKLGDTKAVDWAADGSWIAFCAYRVGGDVIALIKPNGSGFRVLVDGCDPRWLGERLYFKRRSEGGSDLFRLDIDLRSGEARGEPTLVLSGIGDGLSITQDAGTLVYSRAPGNIHIWGIELEGRRGAFRPRTRQLTSGTQWHGSPDITADGRNVAFVSDDALFVMPFAGDSSPRWVATPSGGVVEPRWSPDGSKIAFALMDSSGTGLFVADQGTGRVAKVGTRGPNIMPELSWSPDGGRLVFAWDGRRQLFFVDLATGRDTSLQWDSQYRVFSPRWSPDGREIVATDFVGTDAMDWFARTTVGSGKWMHTKTEISNIRFLRWTADGWIYAAVTVGPPDMPAAVHRMRATGGRFEPYIKPPIHCDLSQMAMSADARRFVCTVERYEPDVWMVQNFDPTGR